MAPNRRPKVTFVNIRDIKYDEGDIGILQQAIGKWADEVSPVRTPFNSLIKLVMEEIPGFLQNTGDPSEYADLVILILDIGYLCGLEVRQAVLDKMEANRARGSLRR